MLPKYRLSVFWPFFVKIEEDHLNNLAPHNCEARMYPSWGHTWIHKKDVYFECSMCSVKARKLNGYYYRILNDKDVDYEKYYISSTGPR